MTKTRFVMPQVASAGVHLWQAFISLDGRRRVGWGGVEPISYAEIESFARLANLELRPIDVAILVEMDNAYLNARVGAVDANKFSPANNDNILRIFRSAMKKKQPRGAIHDGPRNPGAGG